MNSDFKSAALYLDMVPYALQRLIEIIIILWIFSLLEIREVPSDFRLVYAGMIIQPAGFRSIDEFIHAFADDIPVIDLSEFSENFHSQNIREGV